MDRKQCRRFVTQQTNDNIKTIANRKKMTATRKLNAINSKTILFVRKEIMIISAFFSCPFAVFLRNIYDLLNFEWFERETFPGW